MQGSDADRAGEGLKGPFGDLGSDCRTFETPWIASG